MPSFPLSFPCTPPVTTTGDFIDAERCRGQGFWVRVILYDGTVGRFDPPGVCRSGVQGRTETRTSMSQGVGPSKGPRLSSTSGHIGPVTHSQGTVGPSLTLFGQCRRDPSAPVGRERYGVSGGGGRGPVDERDKDSRRVYRDAPYHRRKGSTLTDTGYLTTVHVYGTRVRSRDRQGCTILFFGRTGCVPCPSVLVPREEEGPSRVEGPRRFQEEDHGEVGSSVLAERQKGDRGKTLGQKIRLAEARLIPLPKSLYFIE